MSTPPLKERSVLQMDREINRLSRVEKKYRNENASLKAKLANMIEYVDKAVGILATALDRGKR